MSRSLLPLIVLLTAHIPGAGAQEAPRMEDVVRSPQDYAGKTLEFGGATLSGSLVKYDLGGVRKYYPVVSSSGKTLEAGFFLAPPDLADKLVEKMSPEKNYPV